MGFSDDIVIRISTDVVSAKTVADSLGNDKLPAVENLIVDVRSVSRVGVSDLAANAARIESFLNALQSKLNN